MNLKERLLDSGLVKDNEYLDKYIELIQNHSTQEKRIGKQQKHHIIPRFFFKIEKLPQDDSIQNIANLTFKNHVLAHFYLAMCAEDKYKLYAELAFLFISKFMSIPSLSDLTDVLSEYDKIYDSYIEHHRERMTGHIVSESSRRKISIANTGKKRTAEQRKRISEATKAATTDEMLDKNREFHTGTIWINDGCHSKQIKPNLLQSMLDSGWTLGRLAFSEEARLNMKIANQKIASRIKGKTGYVTNGIKQKSLKLEEIADFLKNNPGWRAGQSPKPEYKGAKFMTNGEKTKRVKVGEIDEYLKNGWKFGKKGLK